MRTLTRFLLLAAIMALAAACEKEESFTMEGIRANESKISAQEIVIYPGENDTEALLNAFNNALPGSVIRLVEGVYQISMIEVNNFSGAFVGAGKGRTIITAHRSMCAAGTGSKGLNNDLIRFVGGKIFISNMTLQAPSWSISSIVKEPIGSMLGFYNLGFQGASSKNQMNVSVQNVEFIGKQLNEGYVFTTAVRTLPDYLPPLGLLEHAHLNISISKCSFRNFYIGADISLISQGRINLGALLAGNHFTDCAIPAMLLDNLGTEINIIHNTFNIKETGFGVKLDNTPLSCAQWQPQTTNTVCNIERNVFNMDAGKLGIFIHDHRRFEFPKEHMPMQVGVRHNQFNMGPSTQAGIISEDQNGLIIRNNRFTGKANLGVSINCEHETIFNECGSMSGNDFCQGNFSTAAIYLGKRARDWTVTTLTLGDCVMNEGINCSIICQGNLPSLKP
ncbi:MAG: hypothetical protein K0B09_14510 [Bacteroidales bacterium]|nr:hypothetical protein [Bacteroidales bacterium]